MDFDRIAEMAADEREAYRAGYLAKMASEGLTPGAVDEMLAADGMEKPAVLGGALKLLGLQNLVGGGGSGGGLSSMATAAVLGIPVGVGGALGWGIANMQNPTKEDIELMEQSALADEYRHQTHALRGEVVRANRRRKPVRRSIGL